MEKQEITQEQISLIRKSLIDSTHSNYLNLINFLKTLPIPQASLQIAYTYLDTGLLWIERMVSTMQLTLSTKVNDDQNQPNK
jgi:hypothetical protein